MIATELLFNSFGSSLFLCCPGTFNTPLTTRFSLGIYLPLSNKLTITVSLLVALRC